MRAATERASGSSLYFPTSTVVDSSKSIAPLTAPTTGGLVGGTTLFISATDRPAAANANVNVANIPTGISNPEAYCDLFQIQF